MNENEKLREATERTRKRLVLYCDYAPVYKRPEGAARTMIDADLRVIAEAAERSLAVPDDAEVLDAIRRMDYHAGCASMPVNEDWQIVGTAALTPSTRWYTLERDGVPTDISKHVIWELKTGKCITWTRGRWNRSWGVEDDFVRYTYLDTPPAEEPLPVEEPLPKCWCRSDPQVWRSSKCDYWVVSCILDPGHGKTTGKTEEVARENWRKLRGAHR